MFENLATRPDQLPIVRRAAAPEGDQTREIELLQRAVASSINETLDWQGDIDFSPVREFDRESFDLQRAEMGKLLNSPVQHTYNYTLWPGWQVITPKYDRDWFVGTGVPWSHYQGKIQVLGSDGFSAAGFGLFLEADEEGLVAIVPHGPCESSWTSFKDSPQARSRAGAGAVVFEGDTLVVSRQPILWDVRGPKHFTNNSYKPDFGKIATPPTPGMFGPVPLSPVLAPIGPGRKLLVWFYHWHIGANMGEKAIFSYVASDVPMVFVNFGKSPIVK